MRLAPNLPDNDEEWLVELRRWAASQPGCLRIAEVETYERCRVAGAVRRLRLDPTNGYIEATMVDGTGALVARWDIERRAPQLAVVPGRRILVEGTPRLDEDGNVAMHDPVFEIVSSTV